ncbi:hypothetical protein [Streptomyces lydicus]|uniref:hypothetical protein n=1 Tax=Streptomyces lydicus TaxID=47763 RepID=UPI0037AC039C
MSGNLESGCRKGFLEEIAAAIVRADRQCCHALSSGKGETGTVKLKRYVTKGVAVAAATLITSATLLTGPAAAATQFPSGDAYGFSVDWSGQWVNVQRLDEITLQLCDASPGDKNKATARLQGYVFLNGTAKVKTAPTVFQVPIGDRKCWAWRDVFLTYFQDGERLDYARVAFYGSEEPSRMSETRWVRNPFAAP